VAEDLRVALQELSRKTELDGDVDCLRDGVRLLAQEVMEVEVAHHDRPREVRAVPWSAPANATGIAIAALVAVVQKPTCRA
jgi:hypothetical protein